MQKSGFILAALVIFVGVHSQTARAEAGAYQRIKWRMPVFMGFTFNDHEATKVGHSVAGYTGIAFGLAVDYRFVPMFSLSGEVLFLTKAYELDNGSTITRYDPKYLQFPVQLKFQPANWVYFHAGPYLASLVLSGTRVGNGQVDAVKFDFDNDYGCTMGVWIGIASNQKLNVGLNIRFDYGLADIEYDKYPGDTVRTRTLMPLFTITWSL